MAFDPYADMIDLRDVIEAFEDDDEEAGLFLAAMVHDLGYGELSDAKDLAENEPTVIARRYFVEYAQELAEDITTQYGEIMENWPLTCIDWNHAAKELEYDYTSFTYDGREYLIRSV